MYQFTAKPIDHAQSVVVDLINGAMEKFGYPWFEFESWPQDLLYPTCDQALADAGYLLDAPTHIPAGACRGMPMPGNWAAAYQITERRP